jgi:hypothetical protein
MQDLDAPVVARDTEPVYARVVRVATDSNQMDFLLYRHSPNEVSHTSLDRQRGVAEWQHTAAVLRAAGVPIRRLQREGWDGRRSNTVGAATAE